MTQMDKPHNFHEERVEICSFEYITLSDGTEVTTYLDDDGQRMYMDWDQQEWLPFPDDWYPSNGSGNANGNATGSDADVLEAGDARVGEYKHPVRGVLTTYLFENDHNTRLYYDEDLGQWARMPLQWECSVPEVHTMLQEITEALPGWNNVNEQLLSLRECNYNLADTIAFGEINFGQSFKAGGKGKGGAGMSLAAAERTAELERMVAAKDEKLHSLLEEKTV